MVELGCVQAVHPEVGLAVQWLQAWLAGLQCHSGCGELWGSCLAAASTPSLTRLREEDPFSKGCVTSAWSSWLPAGRRKCGKRRLNVILVPSVLPSC